MIFYCRNCGIEETNLTAENICVSSFENVDNNDNHETYINEFTKLDSTLPRIDNIKCPNSNCGTNSTTDPTTREIIYVRYNNIDMKLRSANIKIAELCVIKKFGHYLPIAEFL